MPKTSVKVQFGLFALEMRQEMTPTCSVPIQPFTSINDLKNGSVAGRAFISWEPDYWLLDGNYRFLPLTGVVHLGIITTVLSGSAGAFATSPVLTMVFDEEHDIDSLTLHFSQITGDFASEIVVAYYDDTDTLIRTDTYYPNTTNFTTGQPVTGFKKVIVTFNKTNRPYRYLRLQGVDFGELFTFEGEDIREAVIVEESDPLSGELTVNTLDLKLYSADETFNMLNPSGYFSALKERQPLAVYEIVDGIEYFMGQFFLSEWENTSATEIEFHAVDYVGLMDKIRVYGNRYSNRYPISTYLAAYLDPYSIPYEIDSALTATYRGWLPVGTLRETIQKLALAFGAQVDCSRSQIVRFYPARIAANLTPITTITKSMKSSDQRLILLPQQAGVEVTSHTYTSTDTVVKELLNESMEIGVYEIIFPQPMYGVTCTGGTLSNTLANSTTLTVAAAGTVTITGKQITHSTRIHSKYDPLVTTATKPIIKVTDDTFVDSKDISILVDRIYNYYQQRYMQRLRMYAPDIKIGDCVLIDSLYNTQIRAVVERMEIDLANGMVAKVEFVGVKNG